MISVLLTSFKESKTIASAINSLSAQIGKNDEILISAPDEETLSEARKSAKKDKRIKVIQDAGKGKPAALNLLLKKAKGNIFVLTDGDVLVDKGAIGKLIAYFNDKRVGAVSGKVVPSNSKETMFGYWAHLLTDGFDFQRRMKKDKVICSGYLYAIRKGIVKRIPENILADDAYISMFIINKGFSSLYSPESKVNVKYPTSLPDWISQKKRTAGRMYQLAKYFKVSKSESFFEEALAGARSLRQIDEFKHVFWLMFLIIMRMYIWARVFLDFRLWNRSFKKTWQRVETTK